MRHVQTRINNDLFIRVKKYALDKGVTLEHILTSALSEFMAKVDRERMVTETIQDLTGDKPKE